MKAIDQLDQLDAIQLYTLCQESLAVFKDLHPDAMSWQVDQIAVIKAKLTQALKEIET